MIFLCSYCDLKNKMDVTVFSPNTLFTFIDKDGHIIESTKECTCYVSANILNNSFSRYLR